jgi:hypothetical protein
MTVYLFQNPLFSHPPSRYRKALRKTGRCDGCALKHGIELIHDILGTSAAADSKELLLLSAQIAAKVDSSELDDDSRRRFAAIFRDVAYQIEAEAYADTGYLRALCDLKTVTKPPIVGDKNV